MESPDDVRASLAISALADLTDHEATSSAGEARVARFLNDAGVLSWPLIVDADSGLILDGSHRAQVLRMVHGARFVVVQRVSLADPAVRLDAWCRVLEGVRPADFEAARRRLGLEADAPGGLACHYGGVQYGRPGLAPAAAHDLARELAQELESLGRGNGHAGRVHVADDETAAAFLALPQTVLVRLPALDKATVRACGGDGRLPPKSTRFVLPYRVLGLSVPLGALAGNRGAVEAHLRAAGAVPFVCLGAGLVVDRRYPERLWQLADHRIPPALFADPAARVAYEAALARAAAQTASTS